MSNEKGLVERAGLGAVDTLVTGLDADPKNLTAAVGDVRTLLERAVPAAARG